MASPWSGALTVGMACVDPGVEGLRFLPTDHGPEAMMSRVTSTRQ